jgi:hypothetical protein
MHRICALALGLLLALTGEGVAGAWPRKQGSSFVAMGVTLGWPRDIGQWVSQAPTEVYRTLYVEHGLTGRLTLGLDLGKSVSGDDKAVVFLQMPLDLGERHGVMALNLGIGRIGGTAILRPGLALGRGTPGGWLSADALAEIAPESGTVDYKLDLTLGRNLPRDRKLIVQMQLGAPHDDPAFARLAPSMVFPLRGALKTEIGARWGLTGDRAMGFKFGFWTEF